MTALGVFRDDYYNSISVLPNSQLVSTTAGTSTVPASSISGAGDCYLNVSGGAAVTYTTDTAINIIASIQNAVATAYKQGLGAFAAGVNPPSGVPNLFNVSWTLTINNQNSGTLTIAGGTGVTLVGTNAASLATGTARVYVVTVTSPTTVTLQSAYAGVVTAA